MSVDNTLALLLKGYAWLPALSRRQGTRDGGPGADRPLRTRLLGHPVRVLRGPEAVAFFYDERHARRGGALPGPVLDTLFGRGAVHTLDGARHRARKALFLSELTGPAAVADLADRVTGEFRRRFDGLRGREVTLFDEGALVLARAVSDWAGLPGHDAAGVERLGRDCVAMVDGFATAGPRHLRARRARARQEETLRRAVVRARREASASAAGPPRTALEAVVRHREADGSLLDPATAAVELLNIVRPTVAVTWFLTFAAHALRPRPDVRRRLAADDAESARLARSFAHEVRRFYPFVPFLGALAPDGLVLAGERVPPGTMLLLDVYGQNHDPALWDEPFRFVPDRFLAAAPHSDALIPQGGGPRDGHRCPGEDITVTVLSRLARELARLDFTVPDQDLRIPLNRVPTRPRDGFRLVVGPGGPRSAGSARPERPERPVRPGGSERPGRTGHDRHP
ncbi:cytochrome P450 [Streptomyces sp. NPDC053493]|uniref:cytochrome P450 n=1 Tax=Streptomyces sp. NPDC053493 TaxID=3365705 RepID=UPI0037CFA150